MTLTVAGLILRLSSIRSQLLFVHACFDCSDFALCGFQSAQYAVYYSLSAAVSLSWVSMCVGGVVHSSNINADSYPVHAESLQWFRLLNTLTAVTVCARVIDRLSIELRSTLSLR